MTLTNAPLHEDLVLVASDLEPGMDRRLRSLGLRVGAQLSLVRRLGGGARVVSVNGARVALDRTLLPHLTVRSLL